jgi:RNase P subunit RPR2
MIDTHCPKCDADLESKLRARVMDGAGMYFTHTCETCGQVIQVEVELYLEFDIKLQEEPVCQKTP